jgi:NADH-ubiquinone oxidoreductase chain 5
MPNLISNFKLTNIGYYIFGFFNQRFLIEFFYNKFIVNKVLFLGGQTTKVLDKGSVEWIGPYGIYLILNKISKIISGLNKGVVTDYALYILIGICFYLSIFSFLGSSAVAFSDLFFFISTSSIFVLIVSWYNKKESIIFNGYYYNNIKEVTKNNASKSISLESKLFSRKWNR